MRSSNLWKYLLSVYVAVVASGAVASDARVARDAERTVDRATNRAIAGEGPGAVVLIARGEETILRMARGRAQIELDVALSPDHVFAIASATKMFTAATLLKLADQGKVSLDDPLARFLPGFPEARRITLRQLLSHTAGISNRAKDPQPGFARREIDTATHLAEIAKRPLDFAPGSRWAYSNAGYILLGAVIEQVTGEPWHRAVDRQVLAPLGLNRTRYGATTALVPGRVAGYVTHGPESPVTNATYIDLSVPAAAGGLMSTADDLRRWLRALAKGEVVSEAALRQMVRPVAGVPGVREGQGYGLGMMVWRVRGTTLIGHTGQINGFASAAFHLPERDITLVVLSNDESLDARTLARRLAAIAVDQPFPEIVEVQPGVNELQALAGTYRIDENTLRTIRAVDGKLRTQRGSGSWLPLQMSADGKLYFVPDELSYFVAVRGAERAIVALDFYENGEGPPQRLPRAASPPAPSMP